MKLNLESITLNEELSSIVFDNLNKWYKKYFNKELDEKKCQKIIDEYRIIVTNDKAVNYHNLFEYYIIRVTINIEEVKSKIQLKAPFFDFYLGTYIKKLNTINDKVFEEIISGEKAWF